jgi:hypothetical protein
MQPQPTGLRRDLNLVRRRAWLFIPFLLLGIVVAYAFGSVAGDANAVASLTLDTVIQNTTGGGDRGFRIFEAESMTADPEFRQKVVDQVQERTGETDFDYSRYSISLSPIAVADGVSRGVLTVSITDPDKAKAEHYRGAFVDVFTAEYSNPDGLFRTRFIDKKQEVVDSADANFTAQYAKAKPLADAASLPLDELIRAPFEGNVYLIDALADAEGQLRLDLALARAANNTAEVERLSRALADVQAQRATLSDGNMSPELRLVIGDLRAASATLRDAHKALNDARTAAASAQSDIETSYSFSGGLAGSMLGRIAVVIAVTLVFGLIAIYAWEWLSQVRAGVDDRPKQDASSGAS